MNHLRSVSLANARRLAILKQRLAGPRADPDGEGIVDIVRSIGCLQLDPTSAVARSHLLVLWSRLGRYDPAIVDRLLFEERQLFEYLAHAAAIVLTEDYPIHSATMRAYASDESLWSEKTRAWMAANAAFRDYVLRELRERGPLGSKDLEDQAAASWGSTGWTDGRNVGRMLDFLLVRGEVMVAGRQGGQRLWDLASEVLPDWTPRAVLSQRECTRLAAQRSLRMLGVATAKQISLNYTRYRYPHLDEELKGLEAEGTIAPVQVVDAGRKTARLPGTWYIHRDDISLLEQIEAGMWQPRTTLLSPFDNLIADRERTALLFNYRFRLEIYVPREKREYGYYVLAVLHGDRLVGRVDPTFNRKANRLDINAVYAEPDVPLESDAAAAIANAIADLAAFLGATEIAYGPRVPEPWRAALLHAASTVPG